MKKQSMMLATICITLVIAGCNKTADTSPTVPNPAAADQAAAPAEQQNMDKDTLLTVNGEPVTKAMYALYFQDRMRNVPEAKTSPELQMRVLNELANVIIAAQDAEKKGIDKRPEIDATLKLMRAKLLTQTVIQEYAESNKPNENQIKTYYEAEYASQSGQEYKARHILVKEEAQAKSLIEQLDGGADFAELAKANSTGPTGPNGGDLGWFDAKQMVKPFADAVTSMTKGTYSKEPVQTQFGWHVILLEDTRDMEAPTLEGVRGEIITKLQQQSLSGYMQGLRTESKIVFNNDAMSGKPAAEAAATDEAQAADEAASATKESQTEPAASAEAQGQDKPAAE
jgi:peptidyl-prolyl cis-trans isomerase C